jgi:hypothetical protein
MCRAFRKQIEEEEKNMDADLRDSAKNVLDWVYPRDLGLFCRSVIHFDSLPCPEKRMHVVHTSWWCIRLHWNTSCSCHIVNRVLHDTAHHHHPRPQISQLDDVKKRREDKIKEELAKYGPKWVPQINRHFMDADNSTTEFGCCFYLLS